MKIKITNVFTFSALLLVCLLTSCTRSCSRTGEPQAVRSPDEVVKKFVELSAAAKEGTDKQKLEQLCSGEMRRAFERMTDEVFRIAYLTSNVKVTSLRIIDSQTDNDKAKVSYQVSVENNQGTDPTKETNEREVELTRAQGAWFIDSIKLRGTDKVAFLNGMMF